MAKAKKSRRRRRVQPTFPPGALRGSVPNVSPFGLISSRLESIGAGLNEASEKAFEIERRIGATSNDPQGGPDSKTDSIPIDLVTWTSTIEMRLHELLRTLSRITS